MPIPFTRLTLAIVLASLGLPPAVWSIVRAQAGPSAPATSKQAMLDNIARSVLLPGYRDLTSRARELGVAADALAAAPTVSSLKRAQETWTAVLLAWRRTQAFAHGPIADLGIYGRIQAWPSRRQSVDRVLRADRPIDDGYIQELGANAVGLSALEVMLFDPRLDDAGRVAAFTGPQGDRQRRYFLALVRELSKKTAEVERAWQGALGYAATFGAGGQQHLNLLVNDLLAAIESGAQARLQAVLDHRTDPQLHTDFVEGGLSGTSQQGLLALLQGAQAAFGGGDGAGMDDYLLQLKSPAGRRVDAQFKKAIAAVQAIGGPLDLMAGSRQAAIASAHDECRALEILLKAEVASALGVTLTFKSTDGD